MEKWYYSTSLGVLQEKTGLKEDESIFLTERRLLFDIHGKQMVNHSPEEYYYEITFLHKHGKCFNETTISKLYHYYLLLKEMFNDGYVDSGFMRYYNAARETLNKFFSEILIADTIDKIDLHIYELKARFDLFVELGFENEETNKALFYLVETIVKNIGAVELDHEKKYSWYEKFEKVFDSEDQSDVYKTIMSYKTENPLTKQKKNSYSSFKGGVIKERCRCGLYSKKSKNNDNCSNCGGAKPEQAIGIRSRY